MLGGWEWLIIGIIAIVIILWGPAKIPEFAKALGRAKGEFNNASKEFQNAASMPTTSVASTPAPAIKTKEQILIETAHNLGVETEGKTQKQITEEISIKAKLLSAQENS
jgi:sec-independent protein translocase protein TatA